MSNVDSMLNPLLGNSKARLLVSVRNLAEARAAIAGGCDIVDVKEPAHGSLGMASIDVIQQVSNAAAESCFPTSAALGELHEWLSHGNDVVCELPESLAFAKLGLAKVATEPKWCSRWQSVRESFQNRKQSLRWIAVAYADAEQAESPPIEEVLEAAQATRCHGLLIDTYRKQAGHSLFDHVEASRLDSVVSSAKRAGLITALAGQLMHEHFEMLNELPNIIAVRSAVCENKDRQSQVSETLVAQFKRALS